ncbi:hypothetical protein K523DRAFT_126705 [Schizophyllum commune Tattone D]|nr:hypothetical protein K523DRAFT_126705 [Schizophyllum commune Tattone D]
MPLRAMTADSSIWKTDLCHNPPFPPRVHGDLGIALPSLSRLIVLFLIVFRANTTSNRKQSHSPSYITRGGWEDGSVSPVFFPTARPPLR